MDDPLRLENQLCFPLYACAKDVIKRYTPYLEPLGLTYTQYIAMMVLWSDGRMNIKELGRRLYLDTGTLTPMLKKLESKGLLKRQRDPDDERNVMITVTGKGTDLRDEAKHIPEAVGRCIPISQEEAVALYEILYKILKGTECHDI